MNVLLRFISIIVFQLSLNPKVGLLPNSLNYEFSGAHTKYMAAVFWHHWAFIVLYSVTKVISMHFKSLICFLNEFMRD